MQARLGAAEVWDRTRIVDPVVAMRAEQGGGHVGRAGGAGQAWELEVRIAPAALVAGLAGDPGPRRLAAEQQGRAKGRPAHLDQIGALTLHRLQAFGLDGSQDPDGVGARRHPARGAQGRETRCVRRRQQQPEGAKT